MDKHKTLTRRDEQANESIERILRVATILFAEHGFDGVTTREIAAVVGLNIATINYHVGSKQELYHAVFRRLYLQEQELVAGFVSHVDEAVIRNPTAFRDLLERLVDALVAMTLEHPETPRLWVRRWLEKPGRLNEIEKEFSLPLFEMVRDLLERARAAGSIRAEGLDMRLFLKSFTWVLYGYFMSGPLDWEAVQANPFDTEQVAAFKTFLHDYMCRMLDLDR